MEEHTKKTVSDTLDTAEKTGNPLFLWGALFRWLEAQAETNEDGSLSVRRDVTLPSSIADYLLRASFNMQMLGWGKEPAETVKADWSIEKNRSVIKKEKIDPKKAREQITKALFLSYKKNGTGPFKEMQDFAEAHYVYSIFKTYNMSGFEDIQAITKIMNELSLSEKRVRTLIDRGELITKGDFEEYRRSKK